jgi:hypothetical protein
VCKNKICTSYPIYLYGLIYWFWHTPHLLAIFRGYGILLAKGTGGAAGAFGPFGSAPFDGLRVGRTGFTPDRKGHAFVYGKF